MYTSKSCVIIDESALNVSSFSHYESVTTTMKCVACQSHIIKDGLSQPNKLMIKVVIPMTTIDDTTNAKIAKTSLFTFKD